MAKRPRRNHSTAFNAKVALAAIKGDGPEPGSNFSYASKLTEIALLGVLAQRFDTTIEWDTRAGKITNHDELNAFVKERARDGWEYGTELI